MANLRYSLKMQKAIHLAITTHELDEKQKRKGKDIPYITHPLTVGLILARAGGSEEVIIAGLLHDAIEDSIEEKKVTFEMLQDEFGTTVAELVLAVTETEKDKPWEERKAEALAHIDHFNNDAILLKSADILSNGTELLYDLQKDGDTVFERFNAPKEKILFHQNQVTSALLKKWPESPLAKDLEVLTSNLQKYE